MTIRMSNLERLTLAEMEEFVATSRQVAWSAVEPGSGYKLIERVLKAQQYRRLSKGQRGVVRRFLAKITALSRAQLTRLIRRWMDTRRIEREPPRRPTFHRRYTDADIACLAEVDAVQRISLARRFDTSASGPGRYLATSSSTDCRASRPRTSTTCAGPQHTGRFVCGSRT